MPGSSRCEFCRTGFGKVQLPNQKAAPAMRTWLFHWITALLVAVMLLASLPIPYPDWVQLAPWLWMSIHMSAGWALVAVTAIRLLLLAAPNRRVGVRILRPRGYQAFTKIVLLTTLAAVLVTGSLIYRPSPLGFRIYLFGLIEAGALVKLDHATHLQFIISHRYLAYALTAFFSIHTYFAFDSPSRAGPAPISWLWRRACGAGEGVPGLLRKSSASQSPDRPSGAGECRPPKSGHEP